MFLCDFHGQSRGSLRKYESHESPMEASWELCGPTEVPYERSHGSVTWKSNGSITEAPWMGSGKPRGSSTEVPCKSQRNTTEAPWVLWKSLWISHKSSMETPRKHYRNSKAPQSGPMEVPWKQHGSSTEAPWRSLGKCTGLPWDLVLSDSPMIFPRFFRGSPTGLASDLHRSPMVLPWYFRGTLTGFWCVALESQDLHAGLP